MKKNENGNVIIFILAMIVVVVVGVFTLFKNVIAVDTLNDFGINQYISNIIHLHSDYYCRIGGSEKLYGEPTLDDNNIVFEFKDSDNFKFNGYIKDEHIAWVASELYHKGERVTGYFVYPNDVDSWQMATGNFSFHGIHNYPDHELNGEISVKNHKQFFDYIKRKFNAKSESNNIEKQKIENDNNLYPLDFVKLESDRLYYVDNIEKYSATKAIYDVASQDNFIRIMMENEFSPYEAFEHIRKSLKETNNPEKETKQASKETKHKPTIQYVLDWIAERF